MTIPLLCIASPSSLYPLCIPPFPELLWAAASCGDAEDEQTTGGRGRRGMQDALAQRPASAPICTAKRSSFRRRWWRWDLGREVSLAVLGRGGRWATNLCGGCCPLACTYGPCLQRCLPPPGFVGNLNNVGNTTWDRCHGSCLEVESLFRSLLGNPLDVDGTCSPGVGGILGHGKTRHLRNANGR